MTAISRSLTKIWVVPAGTAASELVTTSSYSETNTTGYIAGEIKSYSKSGGEKDVESDPVFGGYVDKEKPQSQIELSFEIVPSLEDATLWDKMIYSTDTATGVFTMATDNSTVPEDRAVYIQGGNGTLYQSWGFNNASVTVLDIEHNADDNQTSNMTLKFSPTDSRGVSNFMTAASSVENLPSWNSLDNN